jgi:hypothetical protein
MNINRHNYEEFFLLYVDKELSAAESKAVDVFVQENPDLQMELALLQQTIVKADDFVLDKKDWLYMEEEITALQENLLLYADDELTPVDKRSVETLLKTDKAALDEWNILQQVKLQPDTTVVFGDRQSLYRTEGGRVVGFKWWRAAAAAILLGFGIWGGISVYKNSFKATANSGDFANESKTQPKQIKTDIQENTEAVKMPAAEKSSTENIANTSDEKNNRTPAIENIKPAVADINRQKTLTSKENVAAQNSNNKKPDNNLPQSYLQNINRNESNETKAASVIPENNSNRVSGNNNAVVRTTGSNEKITNTVVPGLNKISTTDPATTAAIQVVNNKTSDEDNNNRYLDVDDDKGKRTALGGFLRKAKRVLERTTNVKTGDGIKIAGFEIALK